MKLSIFPILRLTLGLVCLIPGMSSAETVAMATYHFSATVGASTCLSQLSTINGTSPDIDFGLLAIHAAEGVAEKTETVTLSLNCSDSPFVPVAVGLAFSIPNGDVDVSNSARLYPRAPASPGTAQTALYYEWSWGNGIENEVDGLFPNNAVNLKDNAATSYTLKHATNKSTWDFPLKITRGVNGSPGAGDYTTSVTVTISYQ